MPGFFSRFSICAKLLAAFSLVLMITIGLGLFTMQRMSLMNEASEELRTDYFPSVIAVGQLTELAQKLRIRESRHIMSTDAGEMSAEEKVMEDLITAYAQARKNYDAMLDPGEETEHYTRIDTLWAHYLGLHGLMIGASSKNENEAAAALFKGEMDRTFFELNDLFDWDMQYNRSHGMAAAERGLAHYHSTITVTEIVIATATLATAVIGYSLVRGISAPLGTMAAAMRRLANQDLQTNVPGIGRGDEIGGMAAAVQVFKANSLKAVALEAEAVAIRAKAEVERGRAEARQAQESAEDQAAITALAKGLDVLANGNLTHQVTAALAPKTQQLKDDFNRAATRLRDTMATITAAIGSMTSGTTEITQAADDLARRTEQQAASLEQTAAALDQVTTTVRKTAEGASHAQAVVSTAKTDAEQSGEVVREAVQAMSEIEKSAQQISQIIGVIDEIAFQTNLLALNAGVEAARAGDAGRGFAVVASEVRALAQRSAEAAKEIKVLISTSSRQVDRGVKLVNQTGQSLQRIAGHVADVHTAVTEIAASAKEQATALHEVNTAINQMDQVTQQNAAMVEESTAASHGLAQETSELNRLTSYFQTEVQGSRPAALAPLRALPALSRSG